MGSPKLPYCLLRKAGETKAPMFVNWADGVEEEAALRWAAEGCGIGLVVHRTTSWVLDFDELAASEPEVAALFGQQGCLVFSTPRGVHVVGKMPFPEEKGRFDVYHNGRLLGAADVFTCKVKRNLVLPIAGTPREKQGGGVLWADGVQRDGECVSLATMTELLTGLAKAYKGLPEGLELVLPSQQEKEEEEEKESEKEGRWRSLLGQDWREASAEAICDVMAKAPVGERHNTLLSLSALWAVRDLGDPAPLRQAALNAWAGEPRAEKEIDAILATVPKVKDKLTYVNGQQGSGRRWEKAGEEDKIKKILTKVFTDGYRIVRSGSDVFIYYKGYAYNAIGLRAYAASLGVNVGKDKADVVIAYAAAHGEQVEAHLVRPWPTVAGDRLVCYVRIGEHDGVLAAKSGRMEFVPLAEAERLGLCVVYGERARVMPVDSVGRPQAYAEQFIEACCALLRTDDRAVACAVAALCSGAARGGVIVLGNPGCGKSTFSLFMQHVCQGAGGFTSPSDIRAFIAACANGGVVGIDESETLDEGTQEMLKMLISFGNINVRKLYTTADLERVPASVSVVLSSVEVRHLAPDLMRRMAVLRIINKPADRVSEEDIIQAIAASANKYLVGAMWLAAPNGHASRADLLHLLRNGHSEGLPDWLAGDSKRDWAAAYWTAIGRAGVDAGQARATWERIRGEARRMGLGRWAEVIDEAATSEHKRHLLANGLTAADIAQYVLDVGGAEEVSKAARGLAQYAAKATTLLEEAGWYLEKIKHRNRLIYRLLTAGEKEKESVREKKEESLQPAAQDLTTEGTEGWPLLPDHDKRLAKAAKAAGIPAETAEQALSLLYKDGLVVTEVAKRLNLQLRDVLTVYNEYNK